MQPTIRPVSAFTPQHYDLLLLADPSLKSIASYLSRSTAFEMVADQRLIGLVVVRPLTNQTAEIMNLAITPKFQRQHFASRLLGFVIEHAPKTGIQKLRIMTGSTSFTQLYLYQKLGFRCVKVLTDHFVNSAYYPEPIYENNLRLRDAIVLERDLLSD